MKTVITRSDERQLKRRGLDYHAGEIVDAADLPEWMRERVEKRHMPLSVETEARLMAEHEAGIEWAREMNGRMDATPANWKALEAAAGRRPE